MIKQWIYRNGEKPFSVTDIELPSGKLQYISVSELGVLRVHVSSGVAFNRNGNFDLHPYDLIPYEPYADFKIDDEVYASDKENDQNNLPRHFAGLNGEGKPTTFDGGQTSFTTSIERYVSSWNFCEKANKEDK